jgi:hypothetical protein
MSRRYYKEEQPTVTISTSGMTRCRIWPAGFIFLAFAALPLTLAQAEEGCAGGQFLSAIDGKCTARSRSMARITFKPRDQTELQAGDVDGTPVARFAFSLRDVTYRGMVRCLDRAPALYVAGRGGTIPEALHALKDTPAEFRDGANQILPAAASYIEGETPGDGVLLFNIKGLNASSFSGEGLMLWSIDNPESAKLQAGKPQDQSNLAAQIMWADQVTAFTFVIAAFNGKSVLPTVLSACSGL